MNFCGECRKNQTDQPQSTSSGNAISRGRDKKPRTEPRSLTQTEISQFSANSPEQAGIHAPHLSLQSVDWISRAFSGPLSLPRKIAFPDGEDRCWWRLGSNAGSVGSQGERDGSVNRRPRTDEPLW